MIGVWSDIRGFDRPLNAGTPSVGADSLIANRPCPFRHTALILVVALSGFKESAARDNLEGDRREHADLLAPSSWLGARLLRRRCAFSENHEDEIDLQTRLRFLRVALDGDDQDP